jgi:hypothetical protein
VSDEPRQTSLVNGSQVLAAGFASAGAALITSRFGVAGTLLGAALTTMIITGGSAILKAYLENVTGNVRKVPRKLRARREQRKARRYAEPETLPERPDLRDNLAGRVRASLDWFSQLPPLTRRSILVKGLIAAVVAFVICMGVVFAVERGIGNSLSCGIWSNCPDGATPGIHLGEDRDTGAGSTLSFGRAKTEAAPGYERQGPVYRQDQQAPSYRQGDPGYERDPDYERDPGYERPAVPSGSRNEPARGILEPERPAEREDPPQPKPPSSASPAPGEQVPPGEGPVEDIDPSDASPAPSE